MLFHMNGTAPSRAGFVLAGGKSSRMGVDKTFVEFRGQTLIERALLTVSRVCERTIIVGDPAKFRNDSTTYGPAVADIFQGCGPLAGIHAALASSEADLNLVLAVDMPMVSSDLLKFIFRSAEKSDAIVTVPRTGAGLQPLCAVYRREFLGPAQEALRSGKYKIDAVFSGLSTLVLEPSQLIDAGFSERMFFNVNTPQDRLDAEGLPSGS